MFPNLVSNAGNLLPSGEGTTANVINALKALGASMAMEQPDDPRPDGAIPAAYTYFGQFIDHDITKTKFDPMISGAADPIDRDEFPIVSADDLGGLVINERTSAFDLDSVYEGFAKTEATAADGAMELGDVFALPPNAGPIPVADRKHDFKRRPPDAGNAEADRQALIGDPRNDENLIVAQLHVAFLRSHNVVQARFAGADAKAQAVRAMRRRYQWAVLHDFLPRICGTAIHARLVADGPSFLNLPMGSNPFMPMEFSVAAYRFGHSMIRQEYDHNSSFNPNGEVGRATFDQLFLFTALSGNIFPAPGPGGFGQLPDNWIIDWKRFFSVDADDTNSPSANPARRIDTRLAFELGQLPGTDGEPLVNQLMGRLASRNLLRGYLLGLPTGQAVAQAIGVPVLTSAQLRGLVIDQAARDACDTAGLFDRTPLWFYVLAEAEINAAGLHLGEVGGTIVGETLWRIAEHSSDSVIADPPTAAELATGEFSLRGIVRIGQDANLDPI
jgi:hypothetical protein